MTKDEALKLAKQLISNLRTHSWTTSDEQYVLKAIDEALAQTEQEPVENYCKECLTYNGHHEGCSHYTTPPQRTWVGLTDEEIADIYAKPFEIVRMAEAKLKEKNT